MKKPPVRNAGTACCIVALLFLALAMAGCGKKDDADSIEKKAESARRDSLFSLIRSADARQEGQRSRIINPAVAPSRNKFTSFSDSAIKSVRNKPLAAPRALPDSANAGHTGKSDTANTLESAIATNAKIIKVDSGGAEDRRLDSLMLIANTLSNRYQQMVMTHTHRNLAEAAHQNPAKTRRLLKNISESAPGRLAQNKRTNEIRQQRLQSLQNQMQLQQLRQQQTGGFIADSGK
jgi:hypothetical protein